MWNISPPGHLFESNPEPAVIENHCHLIAFFCWPNGCEPLVLVWSIKDVCPHLKSSFGMQLASLHSQQREDLGGMGDSERIALPP